jgi:hypothetical protein
MDNIFIVVPEITKGMKSIGSKALLPIKNNISVLEYQIQQIRKFNKKSRIFIGTGFESEKIKKITQKYTNIYYVDNKEYNNTNQSKLIVSLIKDFDINNLLIISNGVIFRNNPFTYDTDDSKVFMLDKPKNNFIIGSTESDNLEYLFYDMPVLWTECVFFNKSSIQQIKDISIIRNIDQFYIFELINTLIEKYNTLFVKTYIKKQNIMKINTIKDIPKAKLFL